MLSKKTKDGVVTTFILTALFVSGSTPLYDARNISASAASMFEPVLRQPTSELRYTPPVRTTTDIVKRLPELERLANQIDELQTEVEAKEMDIAAIKKQKAAELTELRETYVSMDQAIIELSEYVGKTPYGFGDDPSRWDCSGLTLWFYKTYRGIDLEHSATAQMNNGEIVDSPIPGDLVAFRYGRSTSAFHIGVYIGAGMFIHSKNYNADTVLERVEDFASKNIQVAYIRY